MTCDRRIAAVCLLPCLMVLCVRADVVPLTKLTDPSAKCMDGTLGGFYHQHAKVEANKAKWVIHMQGGGECVDSVQCARRFNSSLSSSDFFPDYINLTYDPANTNHSHRKPSADRSSLQDVSELGFRWDKFGWWLCDDNPDTNPELYGYNHVWLPYCSGDLWSGQRLTPTTLPMAHGDNGSDANVSVYFSGHHILGAVLEALDDLGLDDAELIIVSGNSAGGIGMWLSIDYINERYDNPRVLGVSIAGFYSFSFPYTGPNATDPNNGLANFSESAWPAHVRLWDSYMNKACTKSLKVIDLSTDNLPRAPSPHPIPPPHHRLEYPHPPRVSLCPFPPQISPTPRRCLPLHADRHTGGRACSPTTPIRMSRRLSSSRRLSPTVYSSTRIVSSLRPSSGAGRRLHTLRSLGTT
jgi:hypothetical protein